VAPNVAGSSPVSHPKYPIRRKFPLKICGFHKTLG
jgi:hypothetical protein